MERVPPTEAFITLHTMIGPSSQTRHRGAQPLAQSDQPIRRGGWPPAWGHRVCLLSSFHLVCSWGPALGHPAALHWSGTGPRPPQGWGGNLTSVDRWGRDTERPHTWSQVEGSPWGLQTPAACGPLGWHQVASFYPVRSETASAPGASPGPPQVGL